MKLFDVLGVLLGLYTLYAIANGAVYGKHRAWGRTILRDEEPVDFWMLVVIYAVLSVLLVVWF